MEPGEEIDLPVPRSGGPVPYVPYGITYIPPMARTGIPFNDPISDWLTSGGDRFIPDRSSTDFDSAHYMLTFSWKEKSVRLTPSKEAYRRMLDSTLMPKRNRLLSFKGNTKKGSVKDIFSEVTVTEAARKERRYIPHSSDRTLDAPLLANDFCLNLLDWSKLNVLAVALGQSTYMRDSSSGSISQIGTGNEEDPPVTSVSWDTEGQRLAVGLQSSDVQLWDHHSHTLIRTLTGIHQSRVGCLAWNKNTLTTGDLNGLIVNSDVRIKNPIVSTYEGHNSEVCGLKWSGSGKQLASGGNDSVVNIWDVTMAPSTHYIQNQWLHRFRDHTAAVKALAWCPFQSGLLATGGGIDDHHIKLWESHTGTRLDTIDTGSLVSGLLWSKHERELLSTHGPLYNQLTLWNYPSMTIAAELIGHTSTVLYVAQSPKGGTVATASADETLKLWSVFGNTPEVKEESRFLPFSNNCHSYIR